MRLTFINLFIFLLTTSIALSQPKSVRAVFKPVFSEKVEVLRFYISNAKLLKNGKIVAQLSKEHHLIDLEDMNSMKIDFAIDKDAQFDEIAFGIGIDSVTNNSGARGGDLDPLKGMYWTWQTGYINMKLEGKNAANTEFSYHLGGYRPPHNCYRTIRLKVPASESLNVVLDVSLFLAKAQNITNAKMMSTGKDAASLSDLFSSIFRIEN